MKVLTIIPAKLDSTRLEKKNIRQINGKTLVEHSIEYAKNSKHDVDIIVSSESDEVKENVLPHGVIFHNRKQELCGDTEVVDVYLDGTYSTPKNLGSKINTKGREMFPEIWKNDYLYFSSDGYIDGQGGLDIFSVKLNEGKPEEVAYNLPRPINSYSDDFSISFNKPS